MSLSTGTRLGPYEIVALLGAGGMGEVYRARDMKLRREVALKILPKLFAADPERLARFRREAQVLASLNHPHIAAIYGLEEADGVLALVLELVEGPTLTERIAAGPIPVSQALKMASQMADAMEAAHEKAVVHRDLKPANVKITPAGTVKVLDFGLAKALDPEFQELNPDFSPDGRWITYQSNESGNMQVYIAKYPDGSEKTQVSIDGGGEPVWAHRSVQSGQASAGTELFYQNADKLMAVNIRTAPSLAVGKPTLLFEGSFQTTTNLGAHSFAALPDGQHFVFAKAGSQEPQREIRLLLNWFEELKRRVPANK